MPSRRKKKTFEQSQDASWVVETYCRLENVAAQLQEDDSAYPSSQAWMRAGTQDLEALRSGRPWSAASSSSGAHRTGEETSDLLYRATDEGLFATGFNPWRNTWYVTGRPVQVHEKVLDKWLSVKLPLLQGDERCNLVSNIVDEFTALEIDDIVRMQRSPSPTATKSAWKKPRQRSPNANSTRGYADRMSRRGWHLQWVL